MLAGTFSFGQKKAEKLLTAAEAGRIEAVLAADEMRGRRVFSPEIDRAAEFIIEEFRKAGLETWNGSGSYRQDFAIVRPRLVSASAVLDGMPLDGQRVLVITCQPEFKLTPAAGFEKTWIKAGANLLNEARNYARSQKNLLVFVDPSFSGSFSNLTRLRNSFFKTDKSVVFILTGSEPADYLIEATHTFTEQALANVVAVLPGKSRKNGFASAAGSRISSAPWPM